MAVLRIQRVDSLERPELQPYRTMRRQMEHRKRGIFIAEGVKVVERLLTSHFTVVNTLFPRKWLPALQPLLAARPEPEIPVFLADKALLETLTGFSMYQGVLAIGQIPRPLTLEDVVRAGVPPFFFVALDGLADAENLGTLVRNCVALGVQALIVGETSGSPFLRRAVRTSMGAIFQLPVCETDHLVGTLAALQRHGVRCVAAHPHAAPRPLAATDFTRDCCVVFGSEGLGISAPVLAACDEAAAITMAGGVDSLNVGSAAAVFLYEVARQRGKA